MRYLTRDDLLDLHTFVIERWGGRLGIRSQDHLLNALHAPQQVLFDEELYPELAGKAAVLSFQLLKNRPFVDGNEATTLLVLLRFLYINGAALRDTSPEELAGVLEHVLRSDLDRDGLAAWLEKKLATRGECPEARGEE
jgi:death-on-curing protein